MINIGFHHYWNSIVLQGKKHLHLWDFIRELIKEQTKNENNVNQHMHVKWVKKVQDHMDNRTQMMNRIKVQRETQLPLPMTPYEAIEALSMISWTRGHK